MEPLKTVLDNQGVKGVIESLRHHSKVSPTLQPYVSKMPRKDRYSFWTNRENYMLAIGIEQHGIDIDKLMTVVQSKTMDQIKNKIHNLMNKRCKTQAELVETLKTQQQKYGINGKRNLTYAGKEQKNVESKKEAD